MILAVIWRNYSEDKMCNFTVLVHVSSDENGFKKLYDCLLKRYHKSFKLFFNLYKYINTCVLHGFWLNKTCYKYLQENSCRYQNQVLVELILLCLWVLLPSVFFVVFVSRGDPEIRANSASFYAWCRGVGMPRFVAL